MKRLKTLKQIRMSIACFAAALACAAQLTAQEVPGVPVITTVAVQAIHFGSFCITGSGGGTITVAYDGTRTSTGNVVLLANAPYALPAIFEAKLCPGKNVSMHFEPVVKLSGSNGSTMRIELGPSEKGANDTHFISNNDCNSPTILRVGGTLYIPAQAAAGNYSGNFNITLNEN